MLMHGRSKRPDLFEEGLLRSLSPCAIIIAAAIGMTLIVAIMIGLGLHSAIQNLSELA